MIPGGVTAWTAANGKRRARRRPERREGTRDRCMMRDRLMVRIRAA
jgi:hypothetical protein